VIGKILAGSEATMERAREVEARVLSNEASEEDKWSYYAFEYMRGWGLDRLDESFLKTNGIKSFSTEVALLIGALYPSLLEPATAEDAVGARFSALQMSLIRELVQALGFASPFDIAHRIPDLMALWEPRLKDIALFRDYRNSAKLFTSSVKRGPWTLLSLSKSVGMVLRAVGLKLEAVNPKTTRWSGKKVTTYSYRMSPLSVAHMQELVRLRLRGCPRRLAACANEHARALMQLDEFPRWGHLIDRDRPPVDCVREFYRSSRSLTVSSRSLR
jgi:hypothetical protein